MVPRRKPDRNSTRIYELLGVEFDSLNGEAFYNDKMDEGIQILEEKGLLQGVKRS